MASFSAGTTFQDNVAGDVTAAKLEALVNAATPTSGLIQDRTAESAIAADDTLLFGDFSDSNNLKRMTVANFNNVVTTGTGTAASPAIVPTGDTNTGIFFPAADTIAFAEGGAEAMRIDSSGNVGIGITNPTSILHIKKSGAAFPSTSNPQIRLDETSSGRFGLIEFDSSTNLNIWGSDAGSGSIRFFNGTGDGTERLRIDSSGNVGIGTTSPQKPLHVKSSSAAEILRLQSAYDTGQAWIGIYKANGTRKANVGFASSVNEEFFISNEENGPMSFYTNGTERLRITSGGNLLVGTTTEGGGAGYNTRFAVYSSTVDPHISVADTGATITGPYIAWHKAASGNNIFMSFTTESSITLRGLIDYNRGSSVVRYNTTSDETLKNIIGDSSGSESVNILKNTRIRDFNWKNDTTNKVNVGVIAQELYEVFKGAVSVGGDIVKKDSDGNDVTIYQPWGVDKTAFTFHLVAGWQAHEKLIQDLKIENDSLKSRIEALEAA